MKKAAILVVDDDQDLLTAVRILLKPKVGHVQVEPNPENLIGHLDKMAYDLVLLDMNFKSTINTGNEGLFWLSRIKEKYPAIRVIMITAYGAVDLAVKSLKQGASDFVVKPWVNEQLLTTISSTLSENKNQEKKLKNDFLSGNGAPDIIGQSVIMDELQYKLEKIAPTDANILILGENGNREGFNRSGYSKTIAPFT
ncbi:sigma-54-dependent transcriptional regulator [Sphingobacterium sp. SG20118]|uniref:sigma-54-dependent transcriptional regulator n=1 Tax=Sphingobacterium sp. SG20118 TaxID=3367156 RepID=UPI0037DFC458